MVCNLYPFEATVARPGSSHEEIVENIDIGGPSMVRAAAKNYHDVAVVTDPGPVRRVLDELTAQRRQPDLATRERLAAAAFARTAAYDRAISRLLRQRTAATQFAGTCSICTFEAAAALRYGENPHQQAAFYVEPDAPHACVATAEVLHGKELSYQQPPRSRQCAEPGRASSPSRRPWSSSTTTRAARPSARRLADGVPQAYEGDPLSAYGGVLGFNREVDEATAQQITEPNRFIECIIAPGYQRRGLRNS